MATPRIHVLGLGSIGTFTAHGLKDIPSPPAVTLLLHRQSLYDEYLRNNGKITLNTLDGKKISHDDYDVEVCHDGTWHIPPSSPSSSTFTETTSEIKHLILTVKATQTVSALRSLTPRLTSSSTILFLQNGCGMIDDVNEHLFPDPKTRPIYIMGVISHGVTLTSPFNATHTGASTISLGAVPPTTTQNTPNTTTTTTTNDKEYLLQSLPLSPRLTTTTYPYSTLLQIQLEKLSVNAFCNPVCALHNAKNGILFTFPSLRRSILSEISNIVLNLPELQNVPGVKERFSVNRLEETVNGILERTRETTCSMVVDLRAGRETEVRYINGYWVKRGREVGVEVGVNEGLMGEVLARGSN
ncbi:6-phosphogluconate dehydrogenase C-terminal domain-like protein [Aspergillus sclerotiicarbonarius CBS 121057]|uniref:2-dehydropantoate 2-reductase n=1 Tax=Aspergillus sclerotiicarbonarius (strain CBS 121057 / IBT 28362) TaxID=1448318 RepID=A0A319EWB6_ASPSB|nr:6-phosphogluconate dehydrogenase C-terminal domain-like protein [Aspergillus sclerotiicarbonarius CBS 121057]